MNPKNSELLTKKFPKLFQGVEQERRKRDNGETYWPIAFGFQCDDGWFDIIHDLAEKIEAIINALPEDQQNSIYAVQVKEKFGSLRFYMRGSTDEIESLISEAEAKSAVTCEGCSKPGIILGPNWLQCHCKKCYVAKYVERGMDQNEAGSNYDKAKRKIRRRLVAEQKANINNGV